MLQDLVKSYNDTLHHTIGMKPSEVTRGHVEQRLWWHTVQAKGKLCKVPANVQSTIQILKGGSHAHFSHGTDISTGSQQKVDQRNI